MTYALKFIDLFAGLGGFHQALVQLGCECVFASELDDDLAELYCKNFGIKPHGDIPARRQKGAPAGDFPRSLNNLCLHSGGELSK